jgi:hypothetical protein
MKYFFITCLLFVCKAVLYAQPIRLHPANTHYFLYKQKPLALISSGEHYGAVMNMEFNYKKYLETLQKDGLNLTRLFSGVYTENREAFGIQNNTMAPAANNFLCMWARSSVPGYINGGNKFDLTKWDEEYFKRLKGFLQTAADHHIIVEFTLFSSFYMDGQYAMSPLHFKNNITLTDSVPFTQLQVIGNDVYWKYQEACVRKIVSELNAFDNLYYEIQNEPWSDHPDSAGVTTDYYTAADLKDPGQVWKRKIETAQQQSLNWQHKIAAVIADEESRLPKKHLISEDISNFLYSCMEVNQNISVLNFHYALPQTVTANYHWNKAIACNETGFATQDENVYRRQAWRFIMSGGAVFNHLDYSFAVGYENGTLKKIPSHSSGGAVIRRQLGILLKLLHSLNLVFLHPSPAIMKAAKGCIPYIMSNEKTGEYLIYADGGNTCELTIIIPDGVYRINWVNTKTGATVKEEVKQSKNRQLILSSPAYVQDIAVVIKKQ